MKKKGFIIYYDIKYHLQKLSKEQIGSLILAFIAYGEDGIIPDFEDKALDMLFSVYQLQMNRDAEKYERTCVRNSLNAQKRWNSMPSHAIDADTEIDNNTDMDIENDTLMDTDIDCHHRESVIRQPPTIDDLCEYCKIKHYDCDYMEFYYFYASKSWIIGKNPMTNWQVALDGWIQRKSTKKSVKKPNQTIHNFSERDYNYSQIEDVLVNH